MQMYCVHYPFIHSFILPQKIMVQKQNENITLAQGILQCYLHLHFIYLYIYYMHSHHISV
jgi:hypothetical protein